MTGLAVTPTMVGFRRVLDVAGEVDLGTAPSAHRRPAGRARLGRA
jgi:hypothetical protein